MSNNKTVPNSEIKQYVEEYNQILFYQRKQLEKMTELTGRATMLQTIKKNEDIMNCLNELLETRRESREIADEAYKNGLQDGKEAAELAKPIYIYRTVRSYTTNCDKKNTELINAFNEGFEFVRASEVVNNSNGGYCDYIEYILRKEIVNTGG